MDVEPKENSDLLRKRNKIESNGILSHEELRGPPDGGVRAFAVLLGSFLTNGLLFGVINTYSVIYAELLKDLNSKNVTNAETRAALVGSLAMGTTFLLSPISGVLTVLLGIRMTAVLGGSIATAGMVLSSFFVNNLDALYFTYGIMYGLGASFAYTPSLAILGHYFKKYLSLVNGIVTIGSSVFTVIMPPIMESVITNFGLPWLFRLLGLFALCMALCGLLFKPIPVMVITSNKEKGFKPLFLSVVNVHIWKSRRYMFWALAMPVALWGYFVPYVHIKNFIQKNYSNVNENLPLQCIAAGSGVGRLFFGWIGDRPRVDKILLQQMAFYVIGVSTILLPFVNVFGVLVAISLFMGLFDGAFISLIGPVAIELCGAAYAAQGIGCMLGLAAPSLSIGPPVAGHLYGLRDSYTLPFIIAGITSIVGSTLMFAVRFYRTPPIRNTTNGVAAHSTDLRIESRGMLLKNGQANGQPNRQTAL